MSASQIALPRVDALPPWQQRVHAHAARSLDSGGMGHALLLCGPALIGKRVVAECLARRLLCQVRGAGLDACGHCRSCTLFDQRYQTEPLASRPDGRPAHPFGQCAHPDASFVGFEVNDKARPPRVRTEIVIEQVRVLSEKLTLTPQYGGAQVVIVDPADALNHHACNALLKTLEEPRPGRYLWLLAANPMRLPATIRSRCQRQEFPLPPREEALQWLRAQGHAENVGSEALEAARGHPVLADAWLRDGGMALRRAVADDLARLARDGAAVLETAKQWTGDEHAILRLRLAADLAVASAAGLTDPLRTRKLAAWFDTANRTRELLGTTVRADLAVAELLLDWVKVRA
ncbi:DNA polymerase III subunit delta' [soil metagenome]